MTGDIAVLFKGHIKELKGVGADGEFTGLCPFHSDRNPSFSVNLDSGLWICHAGCGDGDATDHAARLGIDPKPYYKGGNGSSPPGTVAPKPPFRAPGKPQLTNC